MHAPGLFCSALLVLSGSVHRHLLESSVEKAVEVETKLQCHFSSCKHRI